MKRTPDLVALLAIGLLTLSAGTLRAGEIHDATAAGEPSMQSAAGAGQWMTPLVERPGMLHSEVLGEDRQYTVCLPYGYEASQERYPVLFLLDGPRHMNYAAGLVEYLSRYAEAISPVIVVDIAQQHRSRDMTPTPSRDRPNDTGGADRFLAFLSQELVLQIEADYRTKRPRVLFGYSLSGLFAIHALLTQPELFDGTITASPAIWCEDNLLVRRAGEFFRTREKLERKLYFTIGANERQEVQNYFNEMSRILQARTPEGFQATLRRLESEDHGTICIPTLYGGLKTMFPLPAGTRR